MSPAHQAPPVHVRAAFGAKEDPELVDGGPVWRCGQIAFRPAADPVEAAWAANMFSTLDVPSMRLAKSLRSTDGRWVIGGWTAFRHLEGRPEPRHDEVVAVSLRLHQATADMPKPRFLEGRTDIYAAADQAAWDDEQPELVPDRGGRLFEVLAASRREVALKPQLVHGDLFGNVLFTEHDMPGLVEFTPYWRPAEWAAAVAVVDALSWGGADPAILHRWGHLPEWSQMLLRALMFRLAVNAMHPNATQNSLRGLENSAHEIGKLL